MEQERRNEAELLIKKVLKEKSFLVLTENEKHFLIDVYNDEMKIASDDYENYQKLPESQKLVNIVILALKEYIGSWHVSTKEMEDISKYIESISNFE
ncbi:hypothetical protein ALC152_02840 [Arcobacter sp. 15-2]|uniref:hypothetical protein n=1 Tax=Arcobacter sp. 15-2 TaxID=3374109 RepID=UPI00399C9730